MRDALVLGGLGGGFGLVVGELTRQNYMMQSVVIGVAGVILVAAFAWKRVKPRYDRGSTEKESSNASSDPADASGRGEANPAT